MPCHHGLRRAFTARFARFTTPMLAMILMPFAHAAELAPERELTGLPASGGYLPETIVQPEYPEEALAAELQGWTQVQFTVDQSGTVSQPEVVDSCVGPSLEDCSPGNDIFDEVSLEAIRQFRFQPRTDEGTAQATQGVQYVFRFVLPEVQEAATPE